ncbi:MAG: hypothetical protein HZB15_09145 [Actinobacteria bacterium]|nr:hypothetical protein [Actinomycetota bacterium]
MLELRPPVVVPIGVRRLTARLAATLIMAVAFVVGPVVVSVAQATVAPASSSGTPDDGTNPFIPEDANIGDCVSALPRPDCGSEAQGGSRQYLILVGLLAGMGFIGWRIARGVRSRDRADASSTNP